MKKSLLSILTLALVAVGCQNYDDQFDSLNKDIASLAATVAGLDTGVAAQVTAIGSQITALETKVTNLSTTVGTSDLTAADLTTSLVDVLQDLADVQAELTALDTEVGTSIAGVVTQVTALSGEISDVAAAQLTTAQVEAIVAVTDQTSALTAVQESLDELLAAEASVNGNVNITNQAELDYAKTLIETDGSPESYIINGNLTVDATGTYTAGTDYTAEINALTSRITSVIGNVTATSASDVVTGTIDFARLTYVSGGYEIIGNFDPTSSILTTAAIVKVPLNSAYPAWTLSALISSPGGLTLTDDTDTDAVSPTSVDVSACTSCGAVTTGVNVLNLPGAAVNLGAGAPAIATTVGSVISTSAAALANTTVIIAVADTDTGADGSVDLKSLTVTGTKIYAGGPVNLRGTGAGSTFGGGSIVFATGELNIGAIQIDGAANIISNTLGTADIKLDAVNIGLLTATTSNTSNIDVSAMTSNTAASTFVGLTVDTSALVTNTGALAITGDVDIQMPALESMAAGITASAASIFYAPKLETTAAKAIDLKDGVKSTGVVGPTITVKTVANINVLTDIATMENLTVLEQTGTVDIDLSTAVLMKTLNYTGALVSTAGSAGNTNDIDYKVTAVTSLTTIDLGGGIGEADIAGLYITTINTTGNIRSFTVSSTQQATGSSSLTTISVGHAGAPTGDAATVSISATAIAALDLSTVTKLAQLSVRDNVSMTTMSFPTGVTTATNALGGVMKTVTITANGIDGALSQGSSATGSSAFVETAFSGVGLTGAKTWLTFINDENLFGAAAADGTKTVSFTIEIDDASAGITTAHQAFTNNGNPGVNSTAIWGTAGGTNIYINSLAELGLLPN
jgi:hypothetical protein